MKKILSFLVLSFALFHNTARAEKKESLEVSRTAQAVGFTQSIDVSGWDRFSAQAVYSDGTPASHTLTDGLKSTATIVVTGTSDLIGAQASVTVTVLSTTAVLGDAVTLAGIVFREGTDWTSVTSTTTAALNLKNRIDAHPDFVATSAGSTVTVKYVSYGSTGNGLTAVTSDATNLKVGAATFTGGLARPTVTINTVTLTEGVDFNANILTTTTAANIKNAINANATLNTQVLASTVSSIVFVTSILSGNNGYTIESSSSGLATTGFTPGIASDINPATDVITKTNHLLTTGLKVLFTATSGSAPTGLTANTTYFAIKLNENQYKLATTSTTAVAGTAIDITAQSGNAAYAVTPLALSVAANNGFFWSASNDNTNFTNLSNVTYSSVTYSAAGNSIYDFGEFGYRYLRFNFAGPTNGGIALAVRVYGKKD